MLWSNGKRMTFSQKRKSVLVWHNFKQEPLQIGIPIELRSIRRILLITCLVRAKPIFIRLRSWKMCFIDFAISVGLLQSLKNMPAFNYIFRNFTNSISGGFWYVPSAKSDDHKKMYFSCMFDSLKIWNRTFPHVHYFLRDEIRFEKKHISFSFRIKNKKITE